MDVSQEFIAQIMKDLDPVDTRRGRALRRCLYYDKSPNRVWHLHNYDKFKPFGFESKRCIDADSRSILWLNILRSNKDQKEVCKVPQRVALILRRRTFLQQALKDTPEVITRMIQLDIRAFYSESLEWWVHFFKGLVHNGIYNTEFLQVECKVECYKQSFL